MNYRLEKRFILDRIYAKQWTMKELMEWYGKTQIEIDALLQETFSKDHYADLKFAMQKNEEEKQKTEA